MDHVSAMPRRIDDLQPLDPAILAQPALVVARALLGQRLVSTVHGEPVVVRIVETEAYTEDERGCHCFGGKRTPRTAPMFLSGGHAYVYFVYGMHWQFNVVTGRAGRGEAVLVRGALVEHGHDAVARRRGWHPGRPAPRNPARWLDGPAKLCQGLGITGAQSGQLLTPDQPVWLAQGPAVRDAAVQTGPRVGIDYAGEDAALLWRFWLGAGRSAIAARSVAVRSETTTFTALRAARYQAAGLAWSGALPARSA